MKPRTTSEGGLNRKVIFVIGESGVGKTTLMNALIDMNNLYWSPVFYTTRPLRVDDDIQMVQSISVAEFQNRASSGKFFVTMSDGVTYYGYLRKDVNVRDGILLLNGSPYIMDEMKHLGKVLLITGDAHQGLDQRCSQKDATVRHQVNRKLSRLFYSDESFQGRVDLFFNNTFKSLDALKHQLHELILTKT